MATMENIPIELVDQLQKSACAFTDDSRLIFMASTEELCLRISVYDTLYNIFRKLPTKVSLTEFFNDLKGNFFNSRLPGLIVVDHQTLVVSYNSKFFYGPHENDVFILLLSVDFCAETFSIVQQLKYTDLKRSLLIKDGSNALLLHKIANQQEQTLLLCHPLKFNNKKLVQTRSDPIKLLVERNQGYGNSTHEHLYNKKLWCIISVLDNEHMYQLSYFDLEQENPMAVIIKTFDWSLNLNFVQCLKSHFLFLTNEGEKELTFFDLDNKEWSTVENNPVLRKYNYLGEKELITFHDGADHFVDLFHFDRQRNIMGIDRIERKMLQIPFGKPRKLKDLVQTTVVNLNCFDQKQLEKIFQKEQIYLK